jgi:glycosyltransferase domain-containing protein
MTPLLVPTRNRPTALSNLLRYLARFHRSSRVIVADGSAEHYQNLNRRNVDAFKHELAIEYRPYPADFPYFDRLLDVLRAEASEFIILGSDDDFPMMDTFREGEAFLQEHSDYALALGMNINLALNSPVDLTAQLFLARPIAADDPVERVRRYSSWHNLFLTSYAVVRREVLIERYERARKVFLVSFCDYAIGVCDCLQGKIRALPKLGSIMTHNYSHSYLRDEAELSFLRRSHEVLQIADQFRRDLMKYSALDEDAAQKETTRLVIERIRVLVGRPAYMLKAFENSPMFSNPVVQKQLDLFDALFEKDTPPRVQYEDKLAFILAALKVNAQSDDNLGEKKKSETLEGQSATAAVLPPAATQRVPDIGRGARQIPGASPPVSPAADGSEKRAADSPVRRIGKLKRLDPETMLRIPETHEKTSEASKTMAS